MSWLTVCVEDDWGGRIISDDLLSPISRRTDGWIFIHCDHEPMRREGLEGTVTSGQLPGVKPVFKVDSTVLPKTLKSSLQTPVTTLGVPQLLSLLTNRPYIHSNNTELREALSLSLQFCYRTRIRIRTSPRERHIRLAWENPKLKASIVPSPRVRTRLSGCRRCC